MWTLHSKGSEVPEPQQTEPPTRERRAKVPVPEQVQYPVSEWHDKVSAPDWPMETPMTEEAIDSPGLGAGQGETPARGRTVKCSLRSLL